MDYYGYLSLLREDIPIYLLTILKKIIELFYRTDRNKFNEKILIIFRHLLNLVFNLV